MKSLCKSVFASQEKDGINRLFATAVVLMEMFYKDQIGPSKKAGRTIQHNKGKEQATFAILC